ncbi:MAG: F0F1 ATP synthase subunit B [Candidatus Firestonebacteria bacterium]
MLDIDWKILAIQIVTFIIGMVLIWKVFVKYFLKILSERATNIKQTLNNIEQQKNEVQKLKGDYEKNLAEIDKKIQEGVKIATKEGIEVKNEIILKAREEAKAILDKTYEKIEIEKEKMFKELRTEVANLAVSIAEKVIRESIDKKTQEKLIDGILEEISGEK